MEAQDRKTLVCGTFAFKTMASGGQPVKTRELYWALSNALGNKVDYLETYQWKKNPVRLIFGFIKKMFVSKSIIMLPAQNGVMVFSRLLLFAKKTRGCRIYYDVIGGWLPKKVENNKRLKKILAQFDGIWVETTILKEELNKAGLTNVFLVRNFKKLDPVDLNQIDYSIDGLKLCFFARVIKEKGIEDAINAVIHINAAYNKNISLDIYGPVSNEYNSEFFSMIQNKSDIIKYCGIVPTEKSVGVLSKYDALIFPTHFRTEGLPGTIIDAYAAGVPVVSAKWDSFSDIIDEGKTGIGYTMFDNEQLEKALLWACEHKADLWEMKRECIKKYNCFSPQTVVSNLIAEFL